MQSITNIYEKLLVSFLESKEDYLKENNCYSKVKAIIENALLENSIDNEIILEHFLKETVFGEIPNASMSFMFMVDYPTDVAVARNRGYMDYFQSAIADASIDVEEESGKKIKYEPMMEYTGNHELDNQFAEALYELTKTSEAEEKETIITFSATDEKDGTTYDIILEGSFLK